MTDLELVDGVTYDAWAAKDHFFTDQFRALCDTCCTDGNVFSIEEFETRAAAERRLEPVFRFFDGLDPDEPRLRWDRLVCLHLVTMAFLNAAGYDMQRSTDEDLARVAARIRHPQVKRNLIRGLARFGLADQPEARRVARGLGAGSGEAPRSVRARLGRLARRPVPLVPR